MIDHKSRNVRASSYDFLFVTYTTKLLQRCVSIATFALHSTTFIVCAFFMEQSETQYCDEYKKKCYTSMYEVCEMYHLHPFISLVLFLLSSARWPEILEVRSPNQEPPMKILIEYFPEAASLVMDNCIQRSSHIQTDPNYTERYDFHLLDPGPDDESGADGKSFFGPTTMVKFHRESLLLHPLTQKLLDVKWTSFGIYIYYFNLSTYLVFLITHTIFVVTERDAQDFNPIKKEPNGTSRAAAASDIFSKATDFNGVVLFLALIFAGANVAKEIFQLVLQKWDYFKDSSNMTEWALYLSTLCFMMPYMFTGEQLDSVFGDLKNPRNFWIPGIISIFLSYINAILFMRRFQTLGIYVNMFLEVTRTVGRVMLLFFIFILAFSIVFYILFKEQVRLTLPV